MAKRTSNSGESLPPPAEWLSPMCWLGSPLRPVANYSRGCPANAAFLRAELVFTLSESIGQGMMRTTEKAVPGLIQFDGGKPVAVHVSGLDGACWTYRRVKVGRQLRWTLYSGPEFPAEREVGSAPGMDSIERVVVQSVLPMEGSERHICIAIRAGGVSEDLANAEE